ncbi:hypothetical protein [Sphingomonas phyllosphaerae]|uniref:hypothetical protein n=1 Tax=Sphingomonas phyllosphaerae TaxID=257003 RepID=UPI0012DEEFB5|nr:hypothetical protein [Sphingomonas phyllosphaerae]
MKSPHAESKVVRWTRKNFPGDTEIIANCTASLASKLAALGFDEKEKCAEGLSTQVNSQYFERIGDGYLYYINIIFDKWGPLKFQVNFAAKEGHEPYKWIRAGSLSRDKKEDMSSRWWGASWMNLSKEKAFLKAWTTLEENIMAIVAFLLHGQTGALIADLRLD